MTCLVDWTSKIYVDFLSHRIHATGIFTYIYHKDQLDVGKYTNFMDPMGLSMEVIPYQNTSIFVAGTFGWVSMVLIHLEDKPSLLVNRST